MQMESFEDELNEIADDGRNDWMTIKRGGEDVEVPNNEVLQRSRLRVDTRKWIMSKILPKRYADTVKQEHSGSVEVRQVVLETPLPPIKTDG